jgi:Cu-processing system permease protein
MKTNVFFSIAKKEIMDNIRNKWIIIISVMFALLTLVVSYFGSIFSHGWQDLGGTIATMMTFVEYLIPIIALMLGYATIIGEIERGSMSSLLSLSVTRFEITLGKYLGLAAVLAFTILVGFGVAGLVIAANITNVNYIEYLIFIGATILYGLIFLSISLFFSTLFKKRSSAIGGAVLIWFSFLFIIPIVFTGVLVAITGLDQLMVGSIPNWYYGLELFNPVSVYSYVISLNVVPLNQIAQQNSTITSTYPSFISNWLIVPILIIWILIFFFLAYWRFNKQDI